MNPVTAPTAPKAGPLLPPGSLTEIGIPAMSPFAESIYIAKYAWKDEDGNPVEQWADTAHRVTKNVMGALGYTDGDVEFEKIKQFITERKFMPGGRYLYASGRDLHQVQNCFSGDTRILTQRGMESLEDLVGQKFKVRNRFGNWESAEARCFGEQELLKVTFANGDIVYATSDHRWWQSNGSRVTTEELESVPFSVAADIPEIELDSEGVRHGIIFGDGHLIKNRYSQIVFVNPDKDESLVDWFEQEERTIEVGFGAEITVDTIRPTKRGTVVSLQPRYFKALPQIYSPEYARGFIAGLIATDGCVPQSGSVQIHCEGLDKARKIAEIAIAGGCVVNSVRVVSRVSPFTGEPRELSCVSIKPFSAPVILPSHLARIEARNLRRFKMELAVESIEATGRVEPVYCAVVSDSESFTLANGLITSNCLLLRAEDSREGWAELLSKSAMALQTGAGIGIDYSGVRCSGTPIKRTGGVASGPLALMRMVNEVGRGVMQGGARRSAIWAGLNWNHGDAEEFIQIKNWDPELRELKERDYNFPMEMEYTNISILLDDEFFAAYDDLDHELHGKAHRIYDLCVKSMLKTAEPGFSVDIGENAGETLRNACCEICSADDSDICNLGSINLSRIESLEEMQEVVRYGTLFLLAGTVYSDLPYDKVDETRTKNRRLGLGVMGVHEWLLKRGKPYGPDKDLHKWMLVYEQSGSFAAQYADVHRLSRPVKTRAIAPTGTIGIVAETTTGIEPIFCVAYKRRVKTASPNGDMISYQYVVDPTAKRLIDEGVAPEAIEDAYLLSYNVEKRIAMQAWTQQFVDHGISSTMNLPGVITDPGEVKDFGDLLYGYLPKLRGLTLYPDGSRGAQPLTAVPYERAEGKEGVVYEETEDAFCKSGSCGA
jgi:ribonucleoside-diphosphate reductase alpha chain